MATEHTTERRRSWWWKKKRSTTPLEDKQKRDSFPLTLSEAQSEYSSNKRYDMASSLRVQRSKSDRSSVASEVESSASIWSKPWVSQQLKDNASSTQAGEDGKSNKTENSNDIAPSLTPPEPQQSASRRGSLQRPEKLQMQDHGTR
ncbi:hypothetical protein DFQ29_004967 [Apophysomyces sp. BC1021]|nr:hypothetical protein DFQ29_004967 [Apophysomyces sp. BC1021]